MKLEAITIEEHTFEINDFSSDLFLKKVNQTLKKGKTSKNIGEGLGIIIEYKEGQKLSLSEQVKVAVTIIVLQAKILIDGEVSSDTHENLNQQEKTSLDYMNNSNRSFRTGILESSKIEIENNVDYDITLLHTLKGTTLGIYKENDNGTITHYVCDTKINGIVNGFIYDELGDQIENLESSKNYYIILRTGSGVDILYGSVDQDFQRVEFISGATVSQMNFYAKHTIGMILEGELYIKNLETGRIIFQENSQGIEDIISVTESYPQTTMIGYYDNEEKYLYGVSDENNVGDYLVSSPREPSLITHPQGVLICVFSPDPLKNTYVVFDSQNLELITDIECFYNSSGVISYGGELNYELMSDGHLWIGYIVQNESGNSERRVYCTRKNYDTKPQYIFPETDTSH